MFSKHLKLTSRVFQLLHFYAWFLSPMSHFLIFGRSLIIPYLLHLLISLLIWSITRYFPLLELWFNFLNCLILEALRLFAKWHLYSIKSVRNFRCKLIEDFIKVNDSMRKEPYFFVIILKSSFTFLRGYLILILSFYQELR